MTSLPDPGRSRAVLIGAGSDTITNLALTHNPAYGRPASIVHTSSRNPAAAAAISAPLPEALAFSLDSPYPAVRIGAVNALSEWLTSDDPARTLAAERRLRQIADADIPAVATAARNSLLTSESAMEAVAPVAHSVRPDENTARRMVDKAAAAMAAIDPDRPARLLTDAEHIAQSIADPGTKVQALESVALAVAATDPDRAGRIAQSITAPGTKAWTLVKMANA